MYKALRELGIRAEIDAGRDKINGKIQNAEQAKVHTMLVIGNRESEAKSVSVRIHGKGNVGVKPFDECLTGLTESIRLRSA